MSTIVVLEIQKDVFENYLDKNKIKKVSKYYEEFEKRVVSILFESRMAEVELYNIMNDNNLMVEMFTLNHFARNRLINNFETDRPELTLTIMGSDKESKLIKIWKKNVKR